MKIPKSHFVGVLPMMLRSNASKVWSVGVAVVASAVGGSQFARADVDVTFSQPGNFGGLTLIDFNDILGAGDTHVSVSSPLTVGGGQANLSSGNMFAVDPSLSDLSLININSPGSLENADGTDFLSMGSSFEIQFDSANVTAIGFDLFKLVSGDDATVFIEIEDFNGDIVFEDEFDFDFDYLAFSSDTFIETIVIEVEFDGILEGSNGLGFDNLRFGDPAVIPAPGAALLGVVGVGLVGVVRRFR
jgi:hypothetical protein